MHRIKSLNECKNKNSQVNYQEIIHFNDVNDTVPEELVINTRYTMPRPKPVYYFYDYNNKNNIKMVFGEI